MKKRGWIVLFLAFPLWMQGQSAREEIGKNPALAAGKYYAYQQKIILTSAALIASVGLAQSQTVLVSKNPIKLVAPLAIKRR